MIRRIIQTVRPGHPAFAIRHAQRDYTPRPHARVYLLQYFHRRAFLPHTPHTLNPLQPSFPPVPDPMSAYFPSRPMTDSRDPSLHGGQMGAVAASESRPHSAWRPVLAPIVLRDAISSFQPFATNAFFFSAATLFSAEEVNSRL